MLETIREFAMEQVAAAGERDTAQGAHAAYYVAFAEEGYPNHFGPFTGIAHRFQQLEAEQANLRAALTYMADRGDAEGVLQLAWSSPGLLATPGPSAGGAALVRVGTCRTPPRCQPIPVAEPSSVSA